MDQIWTTSMSRAYATVLDRLERAISDCPDDLWQQSLWQVKKEHPNVWPVRRAGSKRPGKAEQERLLQIHSQFWNLAYHALFHVDFYLSRADRKGFAPPGPFREDDHHGNVVPHRTYTRPELMHYVSYDREKARATFEALTQDQLERIVARAGVPFGEFLVSTLLHTHEHATQLALFLGQNGIEPRGGAPQAQGRQMLINAVRARGDGEIDRFAKLAGGYPRLLPLVFAGFCANIDPREPASIAFDVGSTYVVRALPGAPAMFEQGEARDVDARVRMSPQDFLRLMVSDLDYDDAVASGAITIDGDANALDRLFAMARSRQ